MGICEILQSFINHRMHLNQVIPPSGLARQLKEGTKKSHRMAENVKFIRLFLKGVIERESY